jgi:hypothetical protein
LSVNLDLQQPEVEDKEIPTFGVYQIVKVSSPFNSHFGQFVGILDYEIDPNKKVVNYLVNNNYHYDADFWIEQNSLQAVDMLEILKALNQKIEEIEDLATKSIKADNLESNWQVQTTPAQPTKVPVIDSAQSVEEVENSQPIELLKPAEEVQAPKPVEKTAEFPKNLTKLSLLDSFAKMKQLQK